METSTRPAIAEGSIVPAKVVRVEGGAAFVDFGHSAEGKVPLDEFPKAAGKPQVAVGDRFDVLVEWLGDKADEIEVSRDKAERLKRYDAVLAACAQGGPLEGTVVARNTGGYVVDVGLSAFLPSSQASTRKNERSDALVGQTFAFDVLEVDAAQPKIVLTRKARAKGEEDARKAALLAKVVEGAVLPGVVRSVTDFGAFVDLGDGLDGLLHVSQMSWTHLAHPREAVQPGQRLQVQVLKVEDGGKKIGLGLKQLQKNPWQHVPERYPRGTEVTGTVAGFAEFGAFVELEPGVQGLVHVSEMAWTGKVKHPSDVVKQGETVRAVVLQVDAEQQRLSLGMRQLLPNPWDALAEKYPEGKTVHGTIRRITEFGMFVELEPGIEGLVHVSELTWTGKVNHPNELYKEGQEVDALVVKLDLEDQRIGLSIKQLQPSPWKTFAAEHPVGSKLKVRITRVVDFGAFAEAAPGIEGLIHVSELAEERVERPADVVRLNQELEVQVVELDLGRRKLGLSVKAMTAISPEEYREHLKAAEMKTTLGDVFGEKLGKK